MAKYTIEIPDELTKYMTENKQPVAVYFKIAIIDPLVKKFRDGQRDIIKTNIQAKNDAETAALSEITSKMKNDIEKSIIIS